MVLVALFLLALAVPPAVAQLTQPLSAVELTQQAQQRYEASRYQEAVSLLQQAVARFAQAQDALNQAMALSNLAAVYKQIGEWESAHQAIHTSLTLLNAQPVTFEQQRILAQTLDIQAQLLLEQGQAQAAFDRWTEAADRYRSLQDADRLLQAQINQSQALQTLGLYPRACKTLLAALQLADAACELTSDGLAAINRRSASLSTVQGMTALGHVLRILEQLDASQQVLALALQTAQRLGATQAAAVVWLNLGNTQRAVASQSALAPDQRDEFEQAAIDAYQQAAQQATQRETQLQAQLNQLSLLAERQDQTDAVALWQRLNAQLYSFPTGRSGLFAELNLAHSLLSLSRHQQPSSSTVSLSDLDRLLTQAVTHAAQLGDPQLQAYALSSQAKLYELQQQWLQAEVSTTQALSLAPAFQAPEIAYQLFWQLGRIRSAQGDIAAGVSHYSQAIEILATLRGDLVAINPDVQFSFRESVEPIYRELVELLLHDTAPTQANLIQARQVIEALQLAELDNFFRDACADVAPRLIDQIDRTAAVFYPIILGDRLEVIVALPNQPLRSHRIDKPQAEFEQSIRLTRTALRRAAFPEEYLPQAQQLYDWLIRPVEPDLAAHNIRTLVFVPDGSLRNLPMAILHDGQQYLIEKYSVALTSGLQLLPAQPLPNRAVRVLLGGLSAANQGFAPLPAVEQEVEQISTKMPANVLLNQAFTRANLERQLSERSFPIIHLATHGQFSSAADQTFLVTWDDRLTVRQLDTLLRINESVRTQQPAPRRSAIELLILSACQTAAGDERAALGMAGIAIRSGARSTLATLWLVNDRATADLIAEFYNQFIQNGTSKAEALRQAQLKLLSQPQSRHPYFWASFVLIGNWL